MNKLHMNQTDITLSIKNLIKDGSRLMTLVLLFVLTLFITISATAQGISFGPVVNYSISADPHQVLIGDVDNDGDNDIVSPNDRDDVVSVLLNDGAGNFTLGSSFNTSGELPKSAAIGDIDDDDDLDIVAGNFGSNNIAVFFNNGAASFQLDSTYAVGSNPRWVELSDLDGDDLLDIVVVNEPNSFSLLYNQGNGVFSAAQSFISGHPLNAAIADVDSDGDNDLVSVNGEGQLTVSVHFNDGDGNFTLDDEYPVDPAAVRIIIGDVNGDTDLDLVVVHSTFDLV